MIPRVIVLLFLLSTVALAAEPAVTITPLSGDPAKDYEGFESFETTMPPSGWYLESLNPNATWTQIGADPYDGVLCAYSPMDIMGNGIDERLGFNYSYTPNQWLHFAVKGQTAANASLKVWVGEDLVFDFAADWTLPADQWGMVEIELAHTNYAGVPNVDFAWQYVGLFAPSLSLDLVGITSEPVSGDLSNWSEVKSMFR